jgi:hypothetical protein
LPVLLLGSVFVLAAIVIMHAGRSTTFTFDEWVFVTSRIGWRPHILLYPHNEHLSLLPVLVYKILFETVGINNYAVFRFVSVLFNLGCGAVLFVYVRRRLGPWIALGFAANLVLTAAGSWDTVWAFQIGFLGSLLTGVAALLLLDDRTRRSDIAACVLVCISLSSSSQGLVFAAAVLLETLLRPDRWRRLWVPAVPIVLYLAWYLKYGYSNLDLANGIPKIPNEILHGLSVGAAAATGMPTEYGGVLAVALVAGVLYTLTRAGARLPRLLAAAALPITFWVIASLARASLPPDEPRYIYPTIVFLVVLTAEAFRLLLPASPIPIVLGAILGLGALASASQLNPVGDTLRGESYQAKARATTAELIGPRIGPDYLIIPTPQVTTYLYYRAAHAYHSTIAIPAARIPTLPGAIRTDLDKALVEAIYPVPKPTTAPTPAGCKSVPGTGKDTIVRLPTRALYVSPGKAPVTLKFRRFSDTFVNGPAAVAPGKPQVASFVPDRSTQPWIAAVSSTAPFKACPA